MPQRGYEQIAPGVTIQTIPNEPPGPMGPTIPEALRRRMQARMGPPASAAAVAPAPQPTRPTAPSAPTQDPAAMARALMERYGVTPPQSAVMAGSGISAPGDMSPAPASLLPGDDVAPTGKPYANELEKMFFEKRQELSGVRAQRNIAEGLGNIHVPTAGEILLGQPKPDRFVAEDLRKREGELEYQTLPENDPSSPESMMAVRHVNQVMGTDFQPGTVSKAQLDQSFPALANMKVAGDAQTARAAEAEKNRTFTAEQNAESRAFSAAEAEKDRAFTAEQMEAKATSIREELEKGKQLTPKQIENIAKTQETVRVMRELQDMKDQFWTGPFDSRFHDIANFFGITDYYEGGSDKSVFKQKLTNQINKYIKEMTGVAMSSSEADRLMEGLPSWTDNDKTFADRLQNSIDEMTTYSDRYIRILESSGYDVSGFQTQGGQEIPAGFTIPGAEGRFEIHGS